MGQILNSNKLALLREVVARHCPRVVDRVGADISGLSQIDRQMIIEALGNELMASGFNKVDEPTPRGLKLEELIDIVNRSNLFEWVCFKNQTGI
jgi:hypothetical protein